MIYNVFLFSINYRYSNQALLYPSQAVLRPVVSRFFTVNLFENGWIKINDIIHTYVIQKVFAYYCA